MNEQMTYSSTITASGQVTLPKIVREFLGVDLGERVSFHIRKNRDEVTISRKLTDAEIAAKIDAMKPKGFEEHIAPYRGMTASELLDQPQVKQHFKEKHGL